MWDGARSLYEMLEIDEAVKPFVNDFKLNLFDYHEWNDFSKFKTENRLLFKALSCGSDVKSMKKMLRKNPNFGRLDLESAKAISGMLGVKMNLETIKTRTEDGEEVFDMCKAFDDYKEEGRREGKREGRREGKREGRREGEMQALTTVVKNLMKNQQITFEVAAEVLEISKTKQKIIRPLI